MVADSPAVVMAVADVPAPTGAPAATVRAAAAPALLAAVNSSRHRRSAPHVNQRPERRGYFAMVYGRSNLSAAPLRLQHPHPSFRHQYLQLADISYSVPNLMELSANA